MCPYYSEWNHVCKIYGTAQSGYQECTYCKEQGSSYTNCVNYTTAKRDNNGVPPKTY